MNKLSSIAVASLMQLTFSLAQAAGFKCEDIKEKAVRAACIADRESRESVTKANPSDDMKLQAAETLIADMTKDPEAARFRDVKYGRDGAICGWINAKNAMGGYVGYQRFLIEDGSNPVFETQGDTMKSLMDWKCS
jgi:hypothetical protein